MKGETFQIDVLWEGEPLSAPTPSKRRFQSLIVAPLLVGAVLPGCAGDDARQAASPEPDEVPVAVVDSVPIAEFGTDSVQALFQVVDALLLPEAVAVAEGSTGTIRFFAHDGGFIRAVGGKGDGPGEFSSLTWLQATSGHLFAWDRGNGRLSRFDLLGSYVGSARVEPVEPYAMVSAIGVLTSGSIVARANELPSNTREQGVVRTQTALLRYSGEGEFKERLGYFEGSETYVEPFGRAGKLSSRLTFGRRSGVAVKGDSLLLLANNDAGIVVLDSMGIPGDTLHPSVPHRRVVEASNIAIARERFVADQTPDLSLAEVFDRMPLPDSFPVYGWEGTRQLRTLRVSRDGRVWAVLHGGIRDPGPTWVVFRSDGAEYTYIRSDTELEILDAVDDLVLVKPWDENDVEHLEIRRVLPRAR